MAPKTTSIRHENGRFLATCALVGVTVPLIVGLAACAGPPDAQQCKEFLPGSIEGLSVDQISPKVADCKARVGTVPVDLRIQRGVFSWKVVSAQVDGNQVAFDQLAQQITYAATLNPAHCSKLFLSEAIDVSVAETPDGGQGCFGLMSGIPVHLQAHRSTEGWLVASAWVEGVPTDAKRIQETVSRQRSIRDAQEKHDQMERTARNLTTEMRRRAIEDATKFHPLSNVETFDVEDEGLYVIGQDEVRLDKDFSIVMTGRLPNVLTNKYKKSVVRVRVKARLQYREGGGWNGFVIGSDVLSNRSY
jgi:hypothetical protein